MPKEKNGTQGVTPVILLKESSCIATDYLKGLAILVVMMNHYYNYFFDMGLAGYANGVISVFFILSGYGIYCSLDKRAAPASPRAVSFFAKRFLRIYPLYWLFLFIWLVRGQKLNVAKLMAIDSVGAWFVTAIVLCYLFAIPFFELLKRVHLAIYGAIVISFVVLVHFGWKHLNVPLLGGVSEYAVCYRGVYFGYLGMFAFGLAIPKLLKQIDNRHLMLPRLTLLLGGVMFSATIQYSQTPIFTRGFLLILSSTTLVLLFLTAHPSLPLRRSVTALGKHSYSLYLFHMFYYELLHRIGIINQHSARSVVITIFLFPLFLGGCMIIDKETNRLMP